MLKMYKRCKDMRTHQVRTQHPHARICMYHVHFHGYIYVCFLKFLTYVHTCRYRILTYMCIQYGFYVTHTHVTHKVNRNKCKTLCAEYMCDIEIYVPHTCVTWILYLIYIYTCHTYIYLNKYKTLKYY